MGKLKWLHFPPAFFGPADPPADVLQPSRSDRDSHRREQRATWASVSLLGKPVGPSSRPSVSWVDGRLSAGHPARRGSESSWPPLPGVAPAQARCPAARAGAVLQVDVRQQDRLIAQGIQQLRVADIVALAVSFHLPVLPHLHQLEDVLVLGLAHRYCTAGTPDAKAYVIALAIDVAVRRRIRLAVPVPLCLSWFLSLLTAPELRPFDFLAHDRARLRHHWPLHSLCGAVSGVSVTKEHFGKRAKVWSAHDKGEGQRGQTIAG